MPPSSFTWEKVGHGTALSKLGCAPIHLCNIKHKYINVAFYKGLILTYDVFKRMELMDKDKLLKNLILTKLHSSLNGEQSLVVDIDIHKQL